MTRPIPFHFDKIARFSFFSRRYQYNIVDDWCASKTIVHETDVSILISSQIYAPQQEVPGIVPSQCSATYFTFRAESDMGSICTRTLRPDFEYKKRRRFSLAAAPSAPRTMMKSARARVHGQTNHCSPRGKPLSARQSF